mmetsp:Transcript_38296/g.123206  ORF Transcript_38296/g.123206 Transcript_38296/m.123206 type:complete len:296 (+) Transcript_38296:209-1096(+)
MRMPPQLATRGGPKNRHGSYIKSWRSLSQPRSGGASRKVRADAGRILPQTKVPPPKASNTTNPNIGLTPGSSARRTGSTAANSTVASLAGASCFLSCWSSFSWACRTSAFGLVSFSSSFWSVFCASGFEASSFCWSSSPSVFLGSALASSFVSVFCASPSGFFSSAFFSSAAFSSAFSFAATSFATASCAAASFAAAAFLAFLASMLSLRTLPRKAFALSLAFFSISSPRRSTSSSTWLNNLSICFSASSRSFSACNSMPSLSFSLRMKSPSNSFSEKLAWRSAPSTFRAVLREA